MLFSCSKSFVPSLCLCLYSVLPFMVDISERVVLSYKNVCAAVVPKVLILPGPDGKKFLKLQASHPFVCRVLAAHNLDLYRECKNPSLSKGECFALLRKKQEEALANASSNQQDDGGEKEQALFKDEQPKKKPRLDNGHATLQLDVGGIKVEVLKPSSYKEKDVSVLLDPSMLTSVFEFLEADCESCFKDVQKRAYTKKTK